ncbi:hypothetical protein KDK95_15915 [Actinospica sp. MGRD01-02]|uniref:Uncharacterized protein n=1 Tax=Actinospica acidithermotolerans TaxID=2828514 RepID=A0A941EA75_9ACTN|nr:hypothetical protein [Actinospica acidithermotolerans]MBR7827806.1 hypothetical protein [Actinospica acidithermotolerans]
MTAAEFAIVVPALHLSTASGDVDLQLTRRYAERAASTWVDRFIVSGSTTRGDRLTCEQRADLLDLWLEVTTPDRLLACSWVPEDLEAAAARHIAPMGVMRGLDDPAAALEYLQNLPDGAFVYSHPMYGKAVFDSTLAATARDADALPRGGKLAKIAPDEIAYVRREAGRAFDLWDGSSRRIEASVRSGASGVVATPLCAFDTELPDRQSDALQRFVDPIQDSLDQLPDRAARSHELLTRACAALSIT